jgi:hypothetical protein
LLFLHPEMIFLFPLFLFQLTQHLPPEAYLDYHFSFFTPKPCFSLYASSCCVISLLVCCWYFLTGL